VKPTAFRHVTLHAGQRGVVLFIALIVLVAMTLAAIALVRSVDTSTVVAGNLAFKESTIQAADQGTDQAVQWLSANTGTGTLNNDNLAVAGNIMYYSSGQLAGGANWWTVPAAWAGFSGSAFTDTGGNQIYIIIHRMCTQPNTTYNGNGAGGVANICSLYFPTSGASTGGSMSVGSFTFQGNPNVYYRITSRVQGPRNTFSYIQTMVTMPN
jgi:type IV pilus assembly protein PilX